MARDKHIAVFVLVMAMCLMLWHGYGGAASRPVYGGTATLAIGEPVTKLDPLEAFVPAEKMITSLIYETLFEKTYSGVRPVLVESWSANEDSTEWTFVLKGGVTFHDGRALTAGDVIYSLQRTLDSRMDLTSGKLFAPLRGVELRTYDAAQTEPAMDRKFTLVLKTSETFLPRLLTHPAFAILPTPPAPDGTTRVPPLVIPSGTGPYVLSDGTTSSRIELAAYEGHHGGRPFIDRLVWRLEQYDDAAIGLRAGTINLFAGPPSPAWDASETQAANARLQISESTHLLYLACNPESAGLLNIEDRARILDAIDRTSILRSIVGQGGRAAHNMLPGMETPNVSWNDADAGTIPGGSKITLLAPRWHVTAGDVADRIQVNLLAVGYDVTVRKLARGEMAYKLAAGDFDLFVGIWYHDPYFGLDSQQLGHFHNTQLVPVPVLRSTHKREMERRRSPEYRSGALITESLIKHAVLMPLFHMDTIVVVGNGLETDSPGTAAMPDLSWTWFKAGVR